MHLYLLRHGIAEDERPGASDTARALTADGKRKLRDVMQMASVADVKPTLILSSPLKRAIQTAEIAGASLKYAGEIQQAKSLIPGSTPEQVWDDIRVHRDEPELVLVGHEPLFSSLASFLLSTPGLRIDFKKGAMMRIDLEGFGARPHGILRWYLVAKLTTKKS